MHRETEFINRLRGRTYVRTYVRTLQIIVIDASPWALFVSCEESMWKASNGTHCLARDDSVLCTVPSVLFWYLLQICCRMYIKRTVHILALFQNPMQPTKRSKSKFWYLHIITHWKMQGNDLLIDQKIQRLFLSAAKMKKNWNVFRT